MAKVFDGLYFHSMGVLLVGRQHLVYSLLLLKTEAEYMAVAEAMKEALWLSGLLGDLCSNINQLLCTATTRVQCI